MKKDNRMIVVITILSIFSCFVFNHEETEKLGASGFLFLVAAAIIINVFLFLKQTPWITRRFVFLCSAMGIFISILILCAEKLKFHTYEYPNLVILEGYILFGAVLIWCAACIWTEKGVTENVVLFICFGGFLIRIFYVVLTQSHIYQNDAGVLEPSNFQHLGYIYYIYSTGKLPNVDPIGRAQFYQPPLHHIISACFLRVFGWMGFPLEESQELLQIPAVMYSTLTLFFLNKIGRKLRIPVSGRAIGLALASFLPFGIIAGGAINNDNLMTLLAVMALYYTLLWYENPDIKKIVLMAVCIGGSMMTKLSGALMAPAMAFLMLHKAWSNKTAWKKYLKQFLCFGIIAFPLGLWHPVLQYIRFQTPFGFIPSPGIDAAQFIGSHIRWSRFLDFNQAFERLSLGWGLDEKTPDYNIPISMVKFAAFGEGDYYYINPVLYVTGNFLFWTILVLGVFIIAMTFLWLFQKTNTRIEKIFVTVLLVVNFYSYIRFCLSYPYVCTMNIRYILAAIYLSFMIFGGALTELGALLKKKLPMLFKIAATATGGVIGIYIAAAVVQTVQMDQLIP